MQLQKSYDVPYVDRKSLFFSTPKKYVYEKSNNNKKYI